MYRCYIYADYLFISDSIKKGENPEELNVNILVRMS